MNVSSAGERKLRIVLLTAGVRGIGSYCINLYQKLTEEGHDVLLISERKWEKQPIDSFYQARSFMLFGMAPVVYRPGAVVREIVRFNPDIIHHHWPCGTMDFLFGAIARTRIPYMVTIHVSLASKKNILDRFWYHLFSFYRRWLRGAGAVNCISDFVRRQLEDRIELPRELVHRVYAGINEDIFHPRRRTRGDDPGISLLFVGQIMPEKGIDLLVKAVIEASKRRRDLTLKIIGYGPLETSLKALSRGHENIEWLGFLSSREEIADCYANADATVLPTRWDEAFSLVPIESLAAGTPVIATARGGTPEAVAHGVTGFLLEDGHVDTLVSLLVSLEKSRLTEMRSACRELVESRHTIDLMGRGHEALYRSVIENSATDSRTGPAVTAEPGDHPV